MSASVTITAYNKLHAYPSAALVHFLRTFSGHKFWISRQGSGESADASSILGILLLDIRRGDTFILTVDGPDAEDVAREVHNHLAILLLEEVVANSMYQVVRDLEMKDANRIAHALWERSSSDLATWRDLIGDEALLERLLQVTPAAEIDMGELRDALLQRLRNWSAD